jgi:hypothetical protein
MGQFFSGIASGRTRCANIAGVKAATAINAVHNRTELHLDNLRRIPSNFIAVPSPRSGFEPLCALSWPV